MTFPIPNTWNRDSADARRDEQKRSSSPCSYFHSQAQSLSLAANYFIDDRLADSARGGVAVKHRHRVHLAIFGQLMAAFEYMLKDFVAQAIDATTVLDETIQNAKWVEVSAAKILASRSMATTPGAMLVHSTLGWHDPEKVNDRYEALFGKKPIEVGEIPDLQRLWILRHSVAHNAGYITSYDASRLNAASLADSVANIDADFIKEARDFLVPIGERVATVIGGALLSRWHSSQKDDGPDYSRDQLTYKKLKQLATMVRSRTVEVPEPSEEDYSHDFPAN